MISTRPWQSMKAKLMMRHIIEIKWRAMLCVSKHFRLVDQSIQIYTVGITHKPISTHMDARSPKLLTALTLIGVSCLSACTQQTVAIETHHYQDGVRISPSTENAVIQRLRKQGGFLMSLGDRMKVVVASDRLFRPASDQIPTDKQAVLRTAASLLREYPLSPINIAAFTDNVANTKNNDSLSQKQAQRVASFLWAEGIQAKRLHVQGRGQQQTVADNQFAQGAAWNRRIEISFVAS